MKKIRISLLVSLCLLATHGMAQTSIPLEPDTLGISVFYGTMVDIKDDVIMVGSGPGLLIPPLGPYIYLFQEQGGQWGLTAKLVANDSADSFFFDAAMTKSESEVSVIVGDINNDEAGTNAGACYLFDYNASDQSWTQVAKLTGGTYAENQSELGTSVAIDGSFAIAGAPKKDLTQNMPNPNDGAVILYEKDMGTGSWIVKEELSASDAQPGAKFGEGVAISGDYAIIGAPFADSLDAGVWGGAAYFFERTTNGWEEVKKVVSSIRSPSQISTDNFGWEVDINGNYAIVGAYTHVISPTNIPGIAIVYERQAGIWEEVAVLVPSDTISSGAFGWDVSIDDNGNAAVASWSSTAGASTYVFKKDGNNWIEQSPKINVAVGTTTSVALEGDRLVFGGSDGNSGFSLLYTGVCTGGVSIEAFPKESSFFHLYPNPVSDRLSIDGILTQASVRLFTLDGQLILQEQITTFSPFLDLSWLTQGPYMIQIREAGRSSSFTLIKWD